MEAGSFGRDLGHLDLELAADSTDASEVIVASRSRETCIDGETRWPWEERQAGSSEAARIHRHRRCLDHERAATAIPSGDINAFVAGKPTTGWAVHILRDLAIAVIARGNATAERAPTPEAEALAGTRNHTRTREAELPVVLTIGKGGPCEEDGNRCD